MINEKNYVAPFVRDQSLLSRGGGGGKNILKDKNFCMDPPPLPRPENGKWSPLF